MTTATTTSTARVYVGTYDKYNNGSIEGAWLDLDSYSDKDAFIEACQELHGPGEHEFMFQDFEGIPEGMVSESHIDEEVWDWMDLGEEDKKLLFIYRAHIDSKGTLEEAEEAYQGYARTAEEAVEEIFTNCYTIPKELENYIDWSRVVRDWECDSYTFVQNNGQTFVFRAV